MVWKSLILGVVFSIGVFAVKCGVGLQYYIFKTASKKKRAGVVGLYALAYLLLFLGSRQALVELDLTKHLAAVMAFMESGMVVHLLMALALGFVGNQAAAGGEKRTTGQSRMASAGGALPGLRGGRLHVPRVSRRVVFRNLPGRRPCRCSPHSFWSAA